MSAPLEIHVASPQELIAAHTNVFDIWSKGLSLEAHIQSRLSSPSHSRATWFVGCLQEQVVVSLGAYPVRFRIGSREVTGIAIGSVYTRKEHRGQGYAPLLLAATEQHAADHGGSLSVLYSDIEPAYYARLGYVLCPSHHGARSLAADQPAIQAADRMEPIQPTEQLSRLAALYDSYHGAAALSFARDAGYWQAMLKKFGDDRFFAMVDSAGNWQGYARIGIKGDAWRLTDYALSDDSADLAGRFYRAVLALAKREGAQQFQGWLPDNSVTRGLFTLAPRKTEITMFKPLGNHPPLTAEQVAAVDRFCELDHV